MKKPLINIKCECLQYCCSCYKIKKKNNNEEENKNIEEGKSVINED